ncbi:NTP transferase domain-containing protein [Paenibacillus polymyxa]|uniref:sugar phosphate nucleotidyltransferase n=1 Tax=Paenibacillus polymyxa TaxID=1406 RepID=UPI001BE8C758|nr:sugar phosphate nucleotidyltransferase [Paenibacillus polymyxa]MBT2282958.1 NTP transferase domain-containing protein [Paenibacillus polymyxa]
MKVVIVCGGRGLRMANETAFRPKPMIPIGGKPIIHHIMQRFAEYGYNQFVLCTGYKGELIHQYFTDSSNYPTSWDVNIVDTGEDASSAERVLRVKSLLDEKFFLCYSDGLSNFNVDSMVRFHDEKGLLCTVLGAHPVSPYGLMEARDGIVTRFSEKPVIEKIINGGFFVMNKAALDYFDNHSLIEEAPMTRLTEIRQLSVYEHHGYWSSMDTAKDIQRLNRLWETGNIPWLREVN